MNGLSESRRICELAAHYDTMVSPHNYMSPLATLVNAHLYAAMPNFEIFEIDMDDMPWKWDLIDQKIEIVDGELIVPSRPGLGANIVESEVAKHPLKSAELTMGRPRLAFGYNPPTGNRKIERIDPATFRADLDRRGGAGRARVRVVVGLGPPHDRGPLPPRVLDRAHLARRPASRSRCSGTIVLANSYRHPALMAKMAASLQYLSGGRFILGYGAGWAEDEYRAYGFDFPSAGTRIDQMIEGIEVIRALWAGGEANYEGQHYRLTEALAVPLPQPVPPIMIGGDGERRTLRAVAHARRLVERDVAPDGRAPAQGRRPRGALRGGRARPGVDRADDHVRGVSRHRRRGRAGGRRIAPHGDVVAFAGDPAAMIDHLAALAELGFEHIQLVFPGFPETADIELFLERVRPEFA